MITILHVGQLSSLTSVCPATEIKFTTIQKGLCNARYWHPSGRRLTVTLGGIWPYGKGGTDIRIVDLLAQKFKFSFSLHPIKDHKEYFAMVRNVFYSFLHCKFNINFRWYLEDHPLVLGN